jgi:hypothetical protein
MKHGAGFWIGLALVLVLPAAFGSMEVVQRRRFKELGRRVNSALEVFMARVKLTRTANGMLQLAGSSDQVHAHLRGSLSNLPLSDSGPRWYHKVLVSSEDQQGSLIAEPFLICVAQKRRFLILQNEVVLLPSGDLHTLKILQPMLEEVLRAHGLEVRVGAFDP